MPLGSSTWWRLDPKLFGFRVSISVQGMIAPHMNDPNWGAHATAMINGNMFRQPVGGRNDDK